MSNSTRHSLPREIKKSRNLINGVKETRTEPSIQLKKIKKKFSPSPKRYSSIASRSKSGEKTESNCFIKVNYAVKLL